MSAFGSFSRGFSGALALGIAFGFARATRRFAGLPFLAAWRTVLSAFAAFALAAWRAVLSAFAAFAFAFLTPGFGAAFTAITALATWRSTTRLVEITMVPMVLVVPMVTMMFVMPVMPVVSTELFFVAGTTSTVTFAVLVAVAIVGF